MRTQSPFFARIERLKKGHIRPNATRKSVSDFRMTRSLVALITMFLLAAARIADLVVTFHFNPSLSDEGNPFVLLFGWGATGLVSMHLLMSAVATSALLAFWLGRSLILDVERLTLSRFVSTWVKYVASTRYPFRDYLVGGAHSNEGLQAFRLFGLVISWVLIFGSFTAVHAWFATRDTSHATTYQLIYAFLRVDRYNYLTSILALVGGLFGAALFFITEYKYISRRVPQN